MYVNPNGIELIVERINSIIAALPASPCTKPTRNDL